MKPQMLLDVDGVLNPSRRPPNQPQWLVLEVEHAGEVYPVRLNPDHGPMLLALAEEFDAELVWATTWVDLANIEIGPRIGLPTLPVIDVLAWPETRVRNRKTPAVAEYVNGRPFVWFDDALSRMDSQYLKGHDNVGDFRIISVGPTLGLNAKHIEQARKWLLENTAATVAE